MFNWKFNKEIPNINIINNNTNNILPQRLLVYSKKHNYFGEGFFIDQSFDEKGNIFTKRHIEKGNINIDWENITKWISINELYENIKDELNN